MDKLVIMGGAKLYGDVEISGAKNAAVAIVPAALLVEGPCVIENVPDIKDIHVIVEILRELGVSVVRQDKHTLCINAKESNVFSAPYDMVQKMRASYYLLGAMVGRFHRAELAMPGGCDFGIRPIDQHIKGIEALGAEIVIKHGVIYAEAERLVGESVYLDVVSVGATINIMLAACRAEGVTVIENAAKEPHIVDLANFLNCMGANIKGAGTDTIKIIGVETLKGGSYAIIPDQIEAGTFMIAAAAAGGDVFIKNVIPKHLESITAKLIEMNVVVEDLDDCVRVRRRGPIYRSNIKTMPYPGFPTDLQPLAVALLSIAVGSSIVTEHVWDNRFQYVGELSRMGAHINIEGQSAYIDGAERLYGAPVRATDLRAGAAMVVAGLAAQGVTEVRNIIHIDRGYEDFEGKLRKLGAQITRRPEEEDDCRIGEAL